MSTWKLKFAITCAPDASGFICLFFKLSFIVLYSRFLV